MCGIAGVFRLDAPECSADDLAALAEMARVQRHRGPDDEGLECYPRCALAVQRLSILDLSPHGHMPMHSEDGQLALVQNGEIYNYVELRAELQSLGWRFRSDGDTEVILRAYQQWGARCVERFVGMWAFALYDARDQSLVLSRDRLGIKPLYVHQTPGRLVFASEIKAIVTYLRCLGEPVVPNEAAIATYAVTGLVDGLEETFFQGVRRFPSANSMRVRATGVQTCAYWDLPARAAARRASLELDAAASSHGFPLGSAEATSDAHAGVDGRSSWLAGARGGIFGVLGSARAWLEGTSDGSSFAAVANTLDEAVRVHLRSDVPLGVCLSGGLDSSALVGLASRHGEQVKTFTVYFDDGPDYDERQHARAIVERFQAAAREELVRPDDLLSTLRNIVWHLDEPSLALGVYPHWHVMQLASREVKVVLDGQGGDEVFAGYMNYVPQHLYGLLAAQPARVPGELIGLGRLHGWPRARAATNSAVRMRLRAARPPTVAARPDAALLTPELRPLADVSLEEWRLWPRVFDGWLTNVLYWELTRTRLPALLRYEDRLSMAFSIESRVPFLDHRLVELAFALPDTAKIRGGWSKYALRRALDDLLPSSVVWRRDKKGFPTPVGNWLRDGRGASALQLLRDPGRRTRHVFPSPSLEPVVAEHIGGRADRSWQLWRALSTELWWDAFFG